MMSVAALLTITACGGDDDDGATDTVAQDDTTDDDTTDDTASDTTDDDTTDDTASDTTAPSETSDTDPPSGDEGETTTVSFLSGQTEDQGSALLLSQLTPECGNYELDIELNTDWANFDAKIQQYAAQDSLPSILHIGTPQQAIDLYEAGQLADIEALLTELDLMSEINPLSVDIQKKLYGGVMLGLPIELALEGFFYNEQVLDENGIEPPATWDELVAAAATLQEAGVQPFATAGASGWPATRLIAGYVHRTVGPEAMSAVGADEAMLTDPDYVAGAQAIAELGDAGYFGEGAASLETQAAQDLFLQGQAAFYYDGTWALSQFADEERNQIGIDNIGFLPFPTVDGGAGTIDQMPANGGFPLMVSADAVTPEFEEWVSCVVPQYGNAAMEQAEILTGFVTTAEPSTQLTKEIVAMIPSITTSLPWFEAPLNPEATDVSQRNAGQLITGNLSAEDFMAEVQAAHDAS